MGKFCAVCGRGTEVGNNVSHSHLKTKRRFKVNLQKKSLDPKTPQKRVLVCTRCLKRQVKLK